MSERFHKARFSVMNVMGGDSLRPHSFRERDLALGLRRQLRKGGKTEASVAQRHAIWQIRCYVSVEF